jgi:GxxExxY protein
MPRGNLIHAELTELLIGIYFEVYNELGYGFLESIYEKAFVSLLTERKIAFQQQCLLEVTFRGKVLGEFKADLIIERAVIVELKAVQKLELPHEKQLLNYLKATTLEVGLLFNFGPTSEFRRLVFENERKLRRMAARSS